MAAEITDASKMPSFACSMIDGSPVASWAMNSDMVNPMPPSQAAPNRCFHWTPDGNRASPSSTASQLRG